MAALPLPGCAAVLAGLVLALVSGSSFAQQVSSGAGGGSGQGPGGGSGQGPGIGQGVGSKCEAAHGGHAGKACDDRDLSTYGDTCTGQETCEGFALQSVATEHAWSLTGTGTWSIGTGTRGVCVRAPRSRRPLRVVARRLFVRCLYAWPGTLAVCGHPSAWLFGSHAQHTSTVFRDANPPRPRAFPPTTTLCRGAKHLRRPHAYPGIVLPTEPAPGVRACARAVQMGSNTATPSWQPC